MVESSIQVTRPPSGIPVPTTKRASLNSSAMTTSAHSPTASGRASPVILSAPPPGKNSPIGYVRRKSLLNSSASSGTWKSTLQHPDTDDPGILKAHINQLNSIIAASYQNSASYLADAGLASSGAGSPRPHTPLNGPINLPSYEVSTPNSDLDRTMDSDAETNGELSANGATLGTSMIPRLPHSNSSYDLRSSAITPGKTPNIRKISDGPLGISRIPQSAVTQGLALHASSPTDSPSFSRKTSSRSRTSSPTPPQESSKLRSPYLGPDSPYSPAPHPEGRISPVPRRITPSGSAASTRVIDGLQTDLINARGHNEKLKQEVRANQRLIGSLTRQNEDLKETKERMRVECEGLNNVISRKERLLQEVLERARAAESSLAQHLSTKKALEQSTKKSLQQMSIQLADAQAAQAKAESESGSLRESVRSLRGVWAKDLKAAREEIKKAEERGRKDLIDARETHIQLVKLVEAQTADRAAIQDMARKAIADSAKLSSLFESQITELKAQAATSNGTAEQASKTASELATELTRLRHLMREPRRASLDVAARSLTIDDTTNHDSA